MKSLFKKSILLLTTLTLTVLSAFADDGTGVGFSPYSKFAVGKTYRSLSAVSSGMGGVGTAMRDHRVINVMNPAAVTARDTLAFMADFGVNQSNSYYRQGSATTVDNAFNLSNFVMSFPIWKSSAFMLGIAPYSSVGYSFSDVEKNPEVIGHTGSISDAYTGTGGLYRIYLGAGVTFWKRLSLGAQFDYYFGSIEKYSMRSFTESNYKSIYKGSQMRLKSFSGRFGLQYEQPVGKDRLTLGATYTLPSSLKGQNYDLMYATQSSVTDTLANKLISLKDVRIPSEISVGVGYRYKDILVAEFNYSWSDWSKSGMDNTVGFKNSGFSAATSQSFNLGFEYVPNRNDIRYFMKRCAYRVGAYYTQDYYKYSGHAVASGGITIGMTIPVFRWLNGITIAIDAGQRGSLRGATQTYSPIRERYVNFSLSMDIFDIWFVKPKYE